MYINPNKTRRRYVSQLKYKTGIASQNALNSINAKFENIEVDENNNSYEVWRAGDGTTFRKPLTPMIEPEKLGLYYAPTKEQRPYKRFIGAKTIVDRISNAQFTHQEEKIHPQTGEKCLINHYINTDGKKFFMSEEEINKKFEYYYEHKDEFVDKEK